MSTLIPRRTRLAPLPRSTPWADFESWQDRLERLIGGAGFPPVADVTTWTPAIDVEEKESEFVLTAECPGMKEKDIAVDVEQNTLTIKGEKQSEREEKKEKNGRWHLVERSWGSFERSFTLPSNADTSRAKASFENGVLTIRLPKREPSTARRVPIKGSAAKD